MVIFKDFFCCCLFLARLLHISFHILLTIHPLILGTLFNRLSKGLYSFIISVPLYCATPCIFFFSEEDRLNRRRERKRKLGGKMQLDEKFKISLSRKSRSSIYVVVGSFAKIGTQIFVAYNHLGFFQKREKNDSGEEVLGTHA